MFKRLIDLKMICPMLVVIITVCALIFCGGTVIDRWGDELYIGATSPNVKEKIVVIDAGHGGEDCGAIGKNGVYEKDLNLQIAKLIGEELSERGATVVFTRTEDKLLYKPEEDIKGIRKISDLKNRCEIANRFDGALFISIHMNSFGEEKYSGLQVYASDNNILSRRIAESIQNMVKSTLQPTNNRKVKGGKGIYVLENINNPAVLVECGFLTNAEECNKLSEKEYQKQLSFAIVCGIIEYIGK